MLLIGLSSACLLHFLQYLGNQFPQREQAMTLLQSEFVEKVSTRLVNGSPPDNSNIVSTIDCGKAHMRQCLILSMSVGMFFFGIVEPHVDLSYDSSCRFEYFLLQG
jgi:hypothetical protein